MPLKPTRRSCSKPKYSDRKSTRLNSSHSQISYAVFCLKKKSEDGPGGPEVAGHRSFGPRLPAGQTGDRLRDASGAAHRARELGPAVRDDVSVQGRSDGS